MFPLPAIPSGGYRDWETKKAIASINKNRFPHIDVLVNNAGLAAGFGPIDEGQYEDWDVMIDTNVKGLLYVKSSHRFTMTSPYFGSNSIILECRLCFSQAIIVVPDPENGS